MVSSAPDPQPRPGEPMGGDDACWLDRVRDCCGTIEGEPHRRGCPDAPSPSDA